jgi:hypothetical protein
VDNSESEDLSDISNPWYKKVPLNPKRKFPWTDYGEKGAKCLRDYYTGNKGPPL